MRHTKRQIKTQQLGVTGDPGGARSTRTILSANQWTRKSDSMESMMNAEM